MTLAVNFWTGVTLVSICQHFRGFLYHEGGSSAFFPNVDEYPPHFQKDSKGYSDIENVNSPVNRLLCSSPGASSNPLLPWQRRPCVHNWTSHSSFMSAINACDKRICDMCSLKKILIQVTLVLRAFYLYFISLSPTAPTCYPRPR
jgi:hypothetical protein